MTSQILEKAREYEETKGGLIPDGDRPRFHLSARVGWMNDPNGFSYYRGEYHLFYQYNPYQTKWGPMHWAHAVSSDLLHWKYLPAALAPDEAYDRSGCFSGSALELADGRHLLMYTGVADEILPDGRHRGVQTQCLAVGDGLNYEKNPTNPVIDEKFLPAGSCRFDFRDPKIWKSKEGGFYCVAGSCLTDGDGQLLLFASEDGFSWKFKSILAKNEGRFGTMWECPDFFELDGKWVLLTSPMDMLAEGLEYHNGSGTLCLVGSFDEEQGSFTDEHSQAIDYGIDFYAPQTVLAPDGRRIMIGWMQSWATCDSYRSEKPWFGQMTIPRELSLRDGRLIQTPVCELERLHTNEVRYENAAVSGRVTLDGIRGRRVDMELNIRPGDPDCVYHKIDIRFAENDQFRSIISFCPRERTVTVDRRYSGTRKASIHERSCYVRGGEDGVVSLRIILDSFSAEVFINGGEQVLSTTIYTDLSADGISFFADGKAVIDVTKYDCGF
jgi:beta-fructofuranosidase